MSSFDDIIGEIDEITGDKNKPSMHVLFICDHSGSMAFGKDQVELENLTERINSLKKEADEIDIFVSMLEFDNTFHFPYKAKRVEQVTPPKEYWTNGMTRLFDAVGFGIQLMEKTMKADTREDKSALVVVMTDGGENDSKEFDGDQIREKVKELEERDDWTFAFTAAGLEAENAMKTFARMDTISTVDNSGKGLSEAHAYYTASMDNYLSSRKRGFKKVDNFWNNGETNGNNNNWNNTQTSKEEGETSEG